MEFFSKGPQERVRNSRGKRAISVRATEVLLYFVIETDQTCNINDLGQIQNSAI